MRIKRSGTRDLNVKVHFIIFFISCNGCCSECCLPQEHRGSSYLNKPHGYCLYYFQYASFYISTYSGLLCRMTAEKRVKLMSAPFLGRMDIKSKHCTNFDFLFLKGKYKEPCCLRYNVILALSPESCQESKNSLTGVLCCTRGG